MENNVKELDTLTKHRYESASAMQEYIDKSNDIAEEMPELIAGYDAEGNAVIDLVKSYNILNEKKKEAAKLSGEARDKAYEEAANLTQDAIDNYNTEKKKYYNFHPGDTGWNENDDREFYSYYDKKGKLVDGIIKFNGKELEETVLGKGNKISSQAQGRLEAALGYDWMKFDNMLRILSITDLDEDDGGFISQELIPGFTEVNDEWNKFV